jgi:hypothetical protein
MLDGHCYFAEFPDEDPAGTHGFPLGPELLAALVALEREISRIIATEANASERDATSDGVRCKSAGT